MHDVKNDKPAFREVWKEGLKYNHKILIKVHESPPGIKVTRKPMVCKSLGKGLVV